MSTPELVWYSKPIFLQLSVAQLWFFLGPIISAFLAAVITHRLSRQRDRENYRLRLEEEAKVAARRVRRDRLLEAYRALDASEPQRVAYRRVDRQSFVQLQKDRAAAYSDINLFGDERLTKQIDVIVQKGVEYDTSILMNLLRDLLRQEYGLELTEARYKWVEVALSHPSENEAEETHPTNGTTI